jgi:hypothetical protein
MQKPVFTYETVIATSERVAWRIEDLLAVDTPLSFDRAHLPEALAGLSKISCLDEKTKQKLNHIRGHSYMNLFAFVEEYIIAQTVRHAEAEMFGDHDAVRALLRFGEEELKHQKLFKRYCANFRRDFPSEVFVLGNAADVANVILSHSAIAVLLVTLHLELMTQQHYVGCVKDDQTLDPLFTKLLRHHWIEEAQHAKIDVLELARLAADAPPELIETAISEYFGILAALDGLLQKQVDLDLESLSAATGRTIADGDANEIREAQRRSYRNDFLVMGMTNPLFKTTLAELAPAGAGRLAQETAKYQT